MSLINNARFTEEYQGGAEAFTISTNTVQYTQAISMESVDQVMFSVGMATAAAGVVFPFDVFQADSSAGVRSASGATVAGATQLILGTTGATGILLARSLIVTITTDATGNRVLVNGAGFTLSTLGGAATLTTSFGSTIDSTNEGGLDAIANSLSSKINASTVAELQGITAATASTLALTITVNDTASTTINFKSDAAAFAPAVISQEKRITIKAAALDSTSKYLCIRLGTAATAVLASVSHIKNYAYRPAPKHGFQADFVAT